MSKGKLARRVALFSTSSFGLAAIASAFALGVTAAPTTALAANECTPTGGTGTAPGDNGATADTYECSVATYATGITYDAEGNLTVTKSNTGTTTVTANGVNLTGNGSEALTWNSSLGTVTGGTGTAGPVISVTTTGSGPISITTASVTGTAASITHGIYAQSTGGGDIAITTTGTVSGTNSTSGVAGIEARTNGGDISITSGTVNGRLWGIIAETTTAGDIDLMVNGNTTASLAAAGALDITVNAASLTRLNASADGAVTITLANSSSVLGSGSVGSPSNVPIVVASDTGIFIDNAAGQVTTSVDFSNSAGGVTFFNSGVRIGAVNRGTWRSLGNSHFSDSDDVVTLTGAGANEMRDGTIFFGGGDDVLNASSFNSLSPTGDVVNLSESFIVTRGALDFGAGNDTFNVSGLFVLGAWSQIDTNNFGSINFGSGNDTLHIFNTEGDPNLVRGTAVVNGDIDFGSGDDTLEQEATLIIRGDQTFSNLEAFNNSGVIVFDGNIGIFSDKFRSDAIPDDALRMTSGVFTGSGDGRIVLDANLGAGSGSQLGCATLGVADCLSIVESAGVTKVTVRDTTFDVNTGQPGAVITLVEGASAAEHFILDPNTSLYADTSKGPTIAKPVVRYIFTYDAPTKRHLLIGAPSDEVFQVGFLPVSTQETWRATTGSWLSRQADLRATPDGFENSRGAWVRIGGQKGERDISRTVTTEGLQLEYDLTHDQRIGHILLGMDFLGAQGEGRAWVFGGMLGWARSDVRWDATSTESVETGFNGGLYASYVAGPIFIDALINGGSTHMTVEAPEMNLGVDVPMTFDLTSFGGQVEAGWRIPLGSGVFVEPLAGASYVGTRFDDTEIPGGSGQLGFEDYESMRYGGGARIGRDADLLGMPASYSLTARHWYDTKGDGLATVTTPDGTVIDLPDQFGGSFTEIDASLNLFSAHGGLSGFVNLGGTFASGYETMKGGLGVRLRW